jgi:tetratricopeptide (TPR) repeat protein
MQRLIWAWCFAIVTSTSAAASGWLRVESPHFTIVGDATESKMVQAAAGLERFLPAITARLPLPSITTSNSLLIYLLNDAASYEPFRAQYDGIATDDPGYFIPGRDLNFITVAATASDTQRILYHELFHALYQSDVAPAAAWLSEGLADYYSTFDRGFGGPIEGHLRTLQESSWIPLNDLLMATHDSPYYKEPALKEKFYAESWLLVHFFLSSGAEGQGLDNLKSLTVANIGNLDNQLHEYAQKLSQNVNSVHSSESITGLTVGIRTTALSDSAAATYSGILFLHLDRLEPAERELDLAIGSEHPSPKAFTWLGFLRLRQNRNAEASELLKRAIQIDANDPFAHFFHSVALNAIAANATSNARRELLEDSRGGFERTVELAPWMFDAYLWLEKVSSALEDYDRTERIRQEREAVVRERNRREDLAAALNPLRLNPPAVITAPAWPPVFTNAGVHPGKAIVPNPTFEGNLSMIDCRKGITLVVRSAEKVVKFHTDTPLHLEFTSKTSNAANEAACGPVYPEHRVVVTYIPRKSPASEGEPIRIFYKN